MEEKNDQNAIYRPGPNELLMVRGAIGDRTTEWGLKVFDVSWLPGPGWAVRIEGHVFGAKFADGIDNRIANQKATIDRLQKHMHWHCANPYECRGWIEKEPT